MRKRARTLSGTVLIGIAIMIVLFIVFTGIIWLLQTLDAFAVQNDGFKYDTFYDYVKYIPAPQMFIIVFFGLGLIGVSAKLISMQLKKNFKRFQNEFFYALENKELMKPEHFRFEEFTYLCNLINPLIEKIIFNETQLQTIIDAQKSLIITRTHDRIINVNRAFLEFFNIDSLEQFTQSHECISEFFSQEDEEYAYPKMDGTHWVNYILRNPLKEHKVMIYKNNEPHIFSVDAKMSSKYEMYRVVITLTDISSIEFERRNLIIDATTDPLTKAANRLKFDTILKQQIELSKRYNNSFCMILLDVDNFKKINDTYGHPIGDQVLFTLAETLRNNVRKSDTVARWGGEEFAIILPHTKLVTGERIAEKLRNKVASIRKKGLPAFTCSFGVSEYNKEQTIETFLHDVDTKLYQAKNSGKNCVIS
jgi:diguanylate cyclase (GGDEF)-like protein